MKRRNVNKWLDVEKLKNKKLHFIIHKKIRKTFRNNEDFLKFINKYKDSIKNVEVFIDDYVIVKYDKI